MNGFINVIKPVGATASDVVVCLKHVLHEKKIGHLGTLDPGASGVLPVAVGLGTKLFDFLTNKVKYYRAFFTFGKTTDTLDSYGKVTDTCDKTVDKTRLETALKSLIGEIDQVPPIYSAISVGGVRAYDLARSGNVVQLRSRKVTIFDIKLINQVDANTFVVDIWCSGGTYIRSIARDVATKLGNVAYMSGLIRLQSGCFDIANAYTLDEIREKKEQCIVDIMYPLTDVPTLELPAELFDDLNFGRKIPWTYGQGYYKLFCKGVFFGLACGKDGILKLDYYLKNAF